MHRVSHIGGAWAPRALVVGVVLALVAAMSPAPANAGHAWANYHWGRTQNPFTVQLGDNVSGPWDGYLAAASGDWSASAVLDTSVVPGRTNPKRCAATSGRVEVCNASYGRNGWLGLASIWTSGGHIVQGTAKMNDTYFNSAPYNDPNAGWMPFVMCQEVGHTFGLGHVNEAFNDPNTGSCMDYTNDPSGTKGTNGTLANLHPNPHDYEMLETIYGHPDGSNTATGATAAGGAGVSGVEVPDPSGPERGGVARFVTDLGGGNQIVTFVIWADANLIATANAAPQAPFVDVATDAEGIPVDGGTHAPAGAGFVAGGSAVTTDAVNLRPGPTRQAGIVAELPAGTVVTVTGATEAGQGMTWVPVVTANGLVGYVAADYLAAV